MDCTFLYIPPTYYYQYTVTVEDIYTLRKIYAYNYVLMHILTRISSLLFVTEIFWAPRQKQQQQYSSSSSPQQALFRATLFLFMAKLFFFRGNTGSFQGHNYREKGHKVQNYYILLFLKKELLNSTLLARFKFRWSVARILYIARKHEFQIAHIPIWTSVSDVDMKFCTSARVTYPPSSPVWTCCRYQGNISSACRKTA